MKTPKQGIAPDTFRARAKRLYPGLFKAYELFGGLTSRYFGTFARGEAAAPVVGVTACLFLLTGLLGLVVSGTTKERWSLVTAQSLVKVDFAEFDIDRFKKRVGGFQQLDLEYDLALLTTSEKGEIFDNLQCLAQNIYFEARNQPTQGKIAVAHVVLNRVKSERFPNTACEVIRQGGQERRHRCQFSWWCDGKSDETNDIAAWNESQKLARDVAWGRAEDPTSGALWYHADYVKPIWRKSLQKGPTIGHHLFYTHKPAKARQQIAELPQE